MTGVPATVIIRPDRMICWPGDPRVKPEDDLRRPEDDVRRPEDDGYFSQSQKREAA
ncbi:hypothetical protein ACSSV4_000802 [Roseovarius sp. MBR-154]|jgi:hypothetical protein